MSDEPQDLARQIHLGKRRDPLGDVRAHVLLRFRVLLDELVRVVFPHGSLLDYFDALVEVADAFNVYAQPEPVEKLWPQLPLLWVHGADEDESRRVRNRYPFTFDGIDAHRRGVQEHVADVVVEQVDLVNLEDFPVRLPDTPRPAPPPTPLTPRS